MSRGQDRNYIHRPFCYDIWKVINIFIIWISPRFQNIPRKVKLFAFGRYDFPEYERFDKLSTFDLLNWLLCPTAPFFISLNIQSIYIQNDYDMIFLSASVWREWGGEPDRRPEVQLGLDDLQPRDQYRLGHGHGHHHLRQEQVPLRRPRQRGQ